MKEIKIKFVRRAGLWCATFFKLGKQIQIWGDTKEEVQAKLDAEAKKNETN